MTRAYKRRGRRGGGGKLTRSETVTVRLDPKLRYLAELAALKQRRTLSSFIEWVIEDSLARVLLYEGVEDLTTGRSVADESKVLWDVDEPDRFAKLALRYPDLLTHDEQKRWKLIRENGNLWRGQYKISTGRWSWTVDERSLCYDRLREHWSNFCSVANGDSPVDVLPKWSETKPTDSDDTDIPF